MVKKDSRVVNASSDYFGTICVCAVRYALGRETYMPTLVQDFIRPVLPYIAEGSLYVIARDIREFGARDPKAYGWECDRQSWMSFLRDCDDELMRRGSMQNEGQ